MAKIKNTTAYPTVIPADDDLLIGTDVNNNNKTVTFKVSDLSGGAPTNQGLNSVLGVGNISALNIELNGSASALGSSISCNDIFPLSISAGGLGQTGSINQVLTADGAGSFTWSPAQGSTLTWQETLTNGNSAISNPTLEGIFTVTDGGTAGVGGLRLEGTTYLAVFGESTFYSNATLSDGVNLKISSQGRIGVEGLLGVYNYGTDGQFLAVNSSETGVEWTSATTKSTPTIEEVLTSGSDTLGQSMSFTGTTTLSLDATSNINSNGSNTFAGNNTFSANGITNTTSGIALTGTLWDGTSTGANGQVLSSYTDPATNVVSVRWINSTGSPTLQDVLNNGNTADATGVNIASIGITGNGDATSSATNGIFTLEDGTLFLDGDTEISLSGDVGTAGYALVSGGPNTLPSWSNISGGGSGTVTSVTGFTFPTINLTNYVSVTTDQSTPAPVITTNLVTDGTVTGGSLTDYYNGQGAFSVPIGTDWDFELSKLLTVVTVKLEDDQATPRATDFTLTEGSSIGLTVTGRDIEIAYTGAGAIASLGIDSTTLDLTQTLPNTNPAVADGSIDINLANTAVTAGSYTNTSLTVDAYGRITAASDGTENDTKYELGAGGTIDSLNILQVSGGTGYAVGAAATTTNSATGSGFAINIVIVDPATGEITATSINSPGAGYEDGDTITISGGNNNATYTVQNIVNTDNKLVLSGSDFSSDTVEFFGTGGTTITTAANVITIDSSTGSGMTSWILTGDSGGDQTVTNGQDVNILGGTFVSTVASATNNITIDLSATGLSATPAETTSQALLGDNTWGFVVKTLGVPLIGAVNTSNTDVGEISYTNTTGDSVMTLYTYGGSDLLGLVPLGGTASTVLAGDGTWKGAFSGASSGVDGARGLVPQPIGDGGTDYDKFLKGDGTWATPAGAGTVTNIATTLPITGGAITSTGTIGINDFGGADGVTAGTKGAVPIPGATDNIKFLKGNGSFVAAMDSLRADDGTGTISDFPNANILEVSAGTNVSVSASQTVGVVNTVNTLTINSTDQYVGTVTSVSVAAPLVTSLNPNTDPITSSGTISMPQATDSVDGYLLSTDWDTFNSKGDGTVTEVSIGTLDGLTGSIDTGTTDATINLTNSDKGSAQNIFKNIAVAGQTDIVADDNSDTLTFAGSNKIVITTDALIDTLTVSLDAFQGATAAVAGTIGGVPAPLAGDEGLFLQGDGTWATPAGAGTVTAVTGTAPIQSSGGNTPDITIDNFVGADGLNDGSKGAVPAPLIANELQFLQGSGGWASALTDFTVTLPITKGGTASLPTLNIDVFTGADALNNGLEGTVPAPLIAEKDYFLKGSGIWAAAPGAYSFNLMGDGGTQQEVTNGETANISGGTIIETVAAAGNIITIDHSLVTRTDPAATALSPGSGGDFVSATSITSSAQGHITAVQFETVTLPESDKYVDWALSGDTGTTQTIGAQQNVTIKGGVGCTTFTDATNTGNLTLDVEAFQGATSLLAGTVGGVTAPTAGQEDYILNGAGTWIVNKEGSMSTFDIQGDGGTAVTIGDAEVINFIGTSTDGLSIAAASAAPNTVTVSLAAFGGADGVTAGTKGAVPAPGITDNVKYLKGDGTWATVPSGTVTAVSGTLPIQSTGGATPDITIDTFTGSTSGVNGLKGAVPAPLIANELQFLQGTGNWVTPTDTQYSVFTGATSVPADGTSGLVPQPLGASADYDKFLKGDGTWAAGNSGTVTAISGGGGGTGLTLTPDVSAPITSSGTLTLGGTLITANGGTGIGTYAIGDILFASATDTLSVLNIGTNGQVLTVNTGATALEYTTPTVGTVTSVDISYSVTGGTAVAGDAAFVASGGPITDSGTLALTSDGTTSQYIDGTGVLVEFPTLTSGTVTSIQLSGNDGTPGTAITSSGVFQIDGTTAGAGSGGAGEGSVTNFYNGIEATADNLKIAIKSFAIPDEPVGWIYKADSGVDTAAGLKRSIIFAEDAADGAHSSVAIANGVTTKQGYNLVLGSGGLAKGFIYNAVGGSYRWSNVDAAGINDSSSSSVFIGNNAGAATTGGSNTIAIGSNALQASASSSSNIAIGTSALAATSSGGSNIALGTSALAGNLTGGSNIALGTSALQASQTTSNNVAIGTSSLTANLGGSDNIAVGTSALAANTEGLKNLAIGVNALAANNLGNNNVAIGDSALAATNSIIGKANTAIGLNALAANTFGECNVAIGKDAQSLTATVQTYNIAIGCEAAKESYGGADIAIGYQALFYGSNSTPAVGTNEETARVAIGYKAQAGDDNGVTDLIQGIGNVSIGGHSGEFNSTSAVGGAVFLGYYAGNNSSQTNKVNINPIAIGKSAMQAGVTSESIALGFQALINRVGGTNQIAIGKNAMAASATVTGDYNIAIGENAMDNADAVEDNIAIGRSSQTKGSDNIAIGPQSRGGNTSIVTGAIGIGNQAAANENYSIAIGANASADADYAISIGQGTNNLNANSCAIGRGASTDAVNQLAIGTALHNLGVTDAVTTFTQSGRWTVKINGVDYYIPLDKVAP